MVINLYKALKNRIPFFGSSKKAPIPAKEPAEKRELEQQKNLPLPPVE